MSVAALDTSVVVAALLAWHDAHDRARRAVVAESKVVLPVTTLTQSFSVMSRLPSDLGVPPARALELLKSAFGARATIVSRAPAKTWDLVARAVAAGARGGGIHDFDILDCAVSAGASRLLTLNPSDFRRFGDRGVEIVDP